MTRPAELEKKFETQKYLSPPERSGWPRCCSLAREAGGVSHGSHAQAGSLLGPGVSRGQKGDSEAAAACLTPELLLSSQVPRDSGLVAGFFFLSFCRSKPGFRIDGLNGED